MFTVTTSRDTYKVDAVVLTTGGNAYAQTGSTGDGYAFARWLWHTITPLWPSLNSFKTVEEYLYPCSGIAFPIAKIKAAGTVTIWPVLLTHFGVTWPAIFAFSSLIPYEKISPETPYQINIQPIADKGYEQRQKILLDAAQSHPKKELWTILREFFPRKFVETMLSHHGISFQMKLADLTKVQRKCMSKEFGEWFTLQLKQRRPGDEFVTAGWVPLTEVHHKTAESLVSPWLYFAGEILDIDGYTGGYNLSSSWAVGKMAADAIAKVAWTKKLSQI
jgi:predicted Rossmann fold flavoprotein